MGGAKAQASTAEELDALPNGSVIINALGEAFLANKDDRHGQRVRLWYYGGNGAFRSERIDLPATVLHVGGSI